RICEGITAPRRRRAVRDLGHADPAPAARRASPPLLERLRAEPVARLQRRLQRTALRKLSRLSRRHRGARDAPARGGRRATGGESQIALPPPSLVAPRVAAHECGLGLLVMVVMGLVRPSL